MKLTFDDVLIEPQFSTIKSRKDVTLYQRCCLWGLKLPVISSNMDTITGPEMATTMHDNGAGACLHRFWEIDQNVDAFKQSPEDTIVSFGLGNNEKERVEALMSAGASVFCLDVAHGAQMAVVEQTKWFKETYPHYMLIVGNFAGVQSFKDFREHLGSRKLKPDMIKIGIGPGSACTTRIKTGCGMPQLSAIQHLSLEARKCYIQTIADGGMRNPGDIAKALAAGAKFVMLGGMLAGTDETPSCLNSNRYSSGLIYRGSASKESYETQNKDWDCAEGESFIVKYKGPVKNVLKDIEGGLRSALTYVGAYNLDEFREKAKFIQVSNNCTVENQAHGQK